MNDGNIRTLLNALTNTAKGIAFILVLIAILTVTFGPLILAIVYGPPWVIAIAIIWGCVFLIFVVALIRELEERY